MSHPKPEETKLAEQLRDDLGVVDAAKLLGVNVKTLSRALGGLYVRPSSVRKLRAGLALAIKDAPTPGR